MKTKVILVPGLGDSGPEHWQTLWEKEHPDFDRIQQRDWETPDRQEWVDTMQRAVLQYNPAQVVLVAHSLACIAVAFWAQQYGIKIKGALLVAPADTEEPAFTQACSGFAPIPMQKLPFSSIVVTSANDSYIRMERARELATAWGSRFVSIGQAGHINAASGYGRWDEGLELLRQLN